MPVRTRVPWKSCFFTSLFLLGIPFYWHLFDISTQLSSAWHLCSALLCTLLCHLPFSYLFQSPLLFSTYSTPIFSTLLHWTLLLPTLLYFGRLWPTLSLSLVLSLSLWFSESLRRFLGFSITHALENRFLDSHPVISCPVPGGLQV